MRSVRSLPVGSGEWGVGREPSQTGSLKFASLKGAGPAFASLLRAQRLRLCDVTAPPALRVVANAGETQVLCGVSLSVPLSPDRIPSPPGVQRLRHPWGYLVSHSPRGIVQVAAPHNCLIAHHFVEEVARATVYKSDSICAPVPLQCALCC